VQKAQLEPNTADADVEEIVQQHSGLNKGDFLVVQERLLLAAKLQAEAPEPHECKNSLWKRQPYTSQSVINGRERTVSQVQLSAV
jgi:hypothetical protein